MLTFHNDLWTVQCGTCGCEADKCAVMSEVFGVMYSRGEISLMTFCTDVGWGALVCSWACCRTQSVAHCMQYARSWSLLSIRRRWTHVWHYRNELRGSVEGVEVRGVVGDMICQTRVQPTRGIERSGRARSRERFCAQILQAKRMIFKRVKC